MNKNEKSELKTSFVVTQTVKSKNKCRQLMTMINFQDSDLGQPKQT
jgi:hypothetical protein